VAKAKECDGKPLSYRHLLLGTAIEEDGVPVNFIENCIKCFRAHAEIATEACWVILFEEDKNKVELGEFMNLVWGKDPCCLEKTNPVVDGCKTSLKEVIFFVL
jgi:hypothetical protein